jgi:hypothetical protein
LKREKTIKILKICWRGLSAIFLLQTGLWIIALTFICYPTIVGAFDKAVPGESIFGPWFGRTLLDWGPLAYLLTFTAWAVYFGFQGIKRIKG